jgi:hypothetical protein
LPQGLGVRSLVSGDWLNVHWRGGLASRLLLDDERGAEASVFSMSARSETVPGKKRLGQNQESRDLTPTAPPVSRRSRRSTRMQGSRLSRSAWRWSTGGLSRCVLPLRSHGAYSDEIGYRFRFSPDRIPADVGQRSGNIRTVSRSEATLGCVNYSVGIRQSSLAQAILCRSVGLWGEWWIRRPVPNGGSAAADRSFELPLAVRSVAPGALLGGGLRTQHGVWTCARRSGSEGRARLRS